MARLKRSSAVLEKAARRMAGMRSIHETLVFGDGLSLAEYGARVQTLQAQLSSYNTMLSTLDEMAGRVGLLEQELRSYSEKMLMSVGTRYGKDSLEYMQAGGTPRKRSTRSSGNAASTSPTAPATTPTAETSTMNGRGTTAAVS